jgi:hypothetical protein
MVGWLAAIVGAIAGLILDLFRLVILSSFVYE